MKGLMWVWEDVGEFGEEH